MFCKKINNKTLEEAMSNIRNMDNIGDFKHRLLVVRKINNEAQQHITRTPDEFNGILAQLMVKYVA